MKWFQNLKISIKLISGFILVAIIAAVVGIVGIMNLQDIGKVDEKLYEHNTVGVDRARTMEVYYQRIRFYSNRMFLLEGSEREEAYNKINEYFDLNEELSKEYAENITSDTNREYFNEMDVLWDEYKVEIMNILDLVKAGREEEAKAILFGDIATLGSELQDAFAALSDYNIIAGKERSDSNIALVNQATTTMIIVICAGILIAVVLGIYISSVISKPINKMVKAADGLALGDVNVAVDVDTKDEVGTLAKSFQRMIENIRGQAIIMKK